MLVITSDWHLSDKTAGLDMPAGAFTLFQERLCDMAYDASQHTDGYKPIDSFDLLLLGDILDPLRSALWTEEKKGERGYARPWSKPDDPAFVKKIDQITDAIIADNAESLETLRRIACGEGVFLPPATQNGEVDQRVSRDPRSSSRLPVQVRIHYMIGNHDWYYHLPGRELDKVRQKIVKAMGLSNTPFPFPYVPSESSALDQMLRDHQVYARHGDFFDPYNIYKQDRDHASISDAVCVELFNRIAVEIENELTHHPLAPEFFRDLKELGSVRPELMTPVWIASLFDRYSVPTQDRQKINDIWHDLVNQFLKLDFLDELNEPFKFDLVDALKAVFTLGRLISMDTLTDWALGIEKLQSLVGLVRSGSMGSKEWATREPAFQSGDARFIVYGHTHQPVVCPIRSIQRSAQPVDQIYLNSGTWHPMHEICSTDTEKKSFVYYKTMTYLGIYIEGERRGKAYESWNGTLDI